MSWSSAQYLTFDSASEGTATTLCINPIKYEKSQDSVQWQRCSCQSAFRHQRPLCPCLSTAQPNSLLICVTATEMKILHRVKRRQTKDKNIQRYFLSQVVPDCFPRGALCFVRLSLSTCNQQCSPHCDTQYWVIHQIDIRTKLTLYSHSILRY